MIDLEPFRPIAKGKNRLIYAHPDHPDRLIKVLNDGRLRRERERGGFARLTKPSYFREYMSEISTVYRAVRRAPTGIARLPIIQAAGLVRTTKGLGMAVERLGTADGSLAPTLKQLIKGGQFDDRVLGRLNSFVEQMFALHIVAEDLDPSNIVWDTASDSFVLVDGFGVKPVIPIHVWSKTINDIQLNQAFKTRLAARAGLQWDQKTRSLRF